LCETDIARRAASSVENDTTLETFTPTKDTYLPNAFFGILHMVPQWSWCSIITDTNLFSHS